MNRFSAPIGGGEALGYRFAQSLIDILRAHFNTDAASNHQNNLAFGRPLFFVDFNQIRNGPTYNFLMQFG